MSKPTVAVEKAGLGRFGYGLSSMVRTFCVRSSIEKGLVSTAMPSFEMSVVERGILGIARDEQHLQVGSHYPRGISDLPTVHSARKPDIGHQQVDRGHGLDNLQPGGAVGGLNDDIAEIVEDVAISMRTMGSSSMSSTVSPRAPPALERSSSTSICGLAEMARQVDAHHRALPTSE